MFQKWIFYDNSRINEYFDAKLGRAIEIPRFYKAKKKILEG